MDFIITLWFLALVLSKSSETPIRICTGGSRSVDLLGRSLVQAPTDNIEIVKSECAKGYRLTGHTGHLWVKSEEVFQECRSLPREYSIQISFQHATPPIHYEYLLTLLAQDLRTTLFAVRYRRGSVLFEYIRETDRLPGYVEFQTEMINNKAWHDLTVAVAGSVVTMTIDCADKYTKDLGRDSFTFVTDIRKTKFFIGSNNRKRRRFTGTVRKVTYVIGADASSLSCLRMSKSSERNVGGSMTETEYVRLNGRETPSIHHFGANSSSEVDGCVRDQSRLCRKDKLGDLYQFTKIPLVDKESK